MIPAYLRKELSVLFFIINKEQTTTSEISHEIGLTKIAVSETLSAINTHFEEHQCTFLEYYRIYYYPIIFIHTMNETKVRK